MYAGFSASTGRKTSSHYIVGWSFSLNGEAGQLDLVRLPIPPREGKSSPYRPPIKAVIAALSVVVFLLLVVLFSVVIYSRRMGIEILEDWERDCPHRFCYKDLLAATKGFNDSELLGFGGFGSVYKGVLPSTGAEIAVKRISNNSLQGLREFAAEIESLGRLRHKNLVNLLGWCKRKNDLLLVYDYIPNGGLDSLLLNSDLYVLNWEQRFNIIKGIASGLLYLHEEWEKVVIHRDVKSSNVLIDADMNGRLGDFGLARLYEHGKNSHTTSVVGTIGYIAPELTRTGKASTKSDVYAYGVLLLEVASGKGPVLYDAVQGNNEILMDWVTECFHTGRILDVVDPRLNSNYVVEEIELVLGLGLLCSLPIPECRPNMRQVTRFLNGDECLPIFDKLCSLMVSCRSDETASRSFFEMISSGPIRTSYPSSSIREMSSSSF